MKRDEERKRLKALRREEIEKKLALVKEVAGNIKGTPYEGRVVCVVCVWVCSAQAQDLPTQTTTQHTTQCNVNTHTQHTTNLVLCGKGAVCVVYAVHISLSLSPLHPAHGASVAPPPLAPRPSRHRRAQSVVARRPLCPHMD